MATFEPGSFVWFIHPEDKWQYGKVIKAFKPGEEGRVKLEDESEFKITKKLSPECVVCDEEQLVAQENLVKMNNLNEPVILHNLRARFKGDKIYTYIGNILIAVNPFKMLPIYTPEILEKYKDGGSRNQPPHIYAIADYAYSNMLADNADQSVVISGESGAGKTETMKLVLQFLAEASGRASKNKEGGSTESLEQQILKSNPVMEAFGNAKTTRNNNSSRFGKWTEVLFNPQGAIVGGSIINYLLEKSRIVFQAKDERNYHIFYQLFAGAEVHKEMKKDFKLTELNDYHYTNQSGVTTVDTINDEKEYVDLMTACDVLNMSDEEKDYLTRTTAAVLWLGNVEFQGQGGDDEISEVKAGAALKEAARLFGVEVAPLTKCLTKKLITGTTFKNYGVSAAGDARDSLSKAIYSQMFDWIIRRINVVLGGAVKKKEAAESGGKIKLTHIGVLDIFGFEYFDTNSFEQLCINFCNEKLQFHFNEHIFKLEQKEYESEGIDVAAIQFKDNQPTLDLIELKTTGILAMIDEEINVPKGSDTSLLAKLLKKHAKHPNFAKPKPKEKDSRKVFKVKHYAAEVPYNITNFLEKNRDALAADICNVFIGSTSKFCSELMTLELGGGGKKKKKGGSKATLGSKFKKSLQDLIVRLNATDPQFVRCMKPNHAKKGGIFTSDVMLDQLRNAGLLEVCRIRQIGFPVRKKFEDFVFRYRCLDLLAAAKGHKELLDALTERGVATAGEWQIGHSKVFMRNLQQSQLEEAREKSLKGVVAKIQTAARGYIIWNRAKRWAEILGRIRKAIETRTEEALVEALSEQPELPLGGAHVPAVKDARALLDRLQEEKRVLGLITDAISARDLAELQSAVAAAKEMSPVYEPAELKTATDLIAVIETEKKSIATLKAAIEKREKEALVAALDEGRKLGEFVTNTDTFKQAEALKKRIDEEEEARAKLKSAMDARDYEAIVAAMGHMVEMGLDGEDVYAAGGKLRDELEAQAKAREALRDATEARSIDQLLPALERAEKVGLAADDEAFAKGRELKARLDKELEAKAALKAATEKNEMAALEAAIGAAKGMAPPLSETLPECQELADAEKALGRLKEIEEAQQALGQAVAQRKLGRLAGAMRKAKEVGVDLECKEMKDAEALIEELGAANEQLMKLDEAINNLDKAEIETNLKACKEMGLGEEEQCEQAVEALKKIDDQDKLAGELAAATESEDQDKLKEGLAEAEKLHLSKRAEHAGTVEAAEKALQRLRLDEEQQEALRAALKSGEVDNMVKALDKAKELGAGAKVIAEGEEGLEKLRKVADLDARMAKALEAKDKEEMGKLFDEAEGAGLESSKIKEVAQVVKRDRAAKETQAKLAASVETGDSDALNAALEKAIELGLEGDEVKAAKAAKDKFDQEKELAGAIRAAVKAAKAKLASKNGVDAGDIAPLQTAIDDALDKGLAEDSLYLKEGNTMKERLEAVIVVQGELEEALKGKKTRLMKKALDTADELELTSQLVKKVRQKVKEIEREQARNAMADDYEDEEDEEALNLGEEEMKKAREEKYARAEHKRFTWTKYARIRSPDDFASGVFFGKARIKANQLRWQSNTINSSLVEFVSRELVKTARLLHKNILGYCGDKTMSFPAMLAQDILHKGLEQPDLVDEIYVQILKQLTNNPRPDSALRAWQLMCMCVGTFPPSHDFENFLLNFLLQHKDRSGAVGNYARYALRRLEGIMNSGPTGFVPTVEEIYAYKERPPVLATIELVDGTPLTEDLPVTPDLNVEKVMTVCRGFLELQDPRTRYMGVFVYDIDEEVEDEEENELGKEGDDEEEDHISKLPKTARPLRNENFLGDVVTIKVREQQKFKLVYKRKIFLLDDEPDVTPEDEAYDERFEQLMHLQAVDDIINNNIALETEEQVCLFLALAMVVDYGADVGVDAETLVEQEIMEYVPYIWRESHEAAWWAEKTVEVCEKEGDQNPLEMEAIEARESLMRMTKSDELYGTFFFHVKKKNDRGGWTSDLPEEMFAVPDYFVVGIKFSGLRFYDPDTMEERVRFGFEDVYRWGGSKVSFCLELWFKELEDTRELEMWTGQAPDIASLMLDYINAVMEVRAPGS